VAYSRPPRALRILPCRRVYSDSNAPRCGWKPPYSTVNAFENMYRGFRGKKSRRERVGRISTLEGARKKGGSCNEKEEREGRTCLAIEDCVTEAQQRRDLVGGRRRTKSGSVSCRAELMPKARTVGDAATRHQTGMQADVW
jgi:hypothetical protein